MTGPNSKSHMAAIATQSAGRYHEVVVQRSGTVGGKGMTTKQRQRRLIV